MTSVWAKSKQSGGKLLCLLALADNADDDGYCYPGIETIAKKSRMSGRSVQRILGELKNDGELEIHPNKGKNGTNLYRVIAGGDKLSGGGDKCVPEMSPGGVTQLCRGGGDTAMSPEPSVNRQLEPSGTVPPSEVAKGVTSFHQAFTDGWCRRFEGRFRFKYVFAGGKDGTAVKKLASLGMTAEEILTLAEKAWDSPKPFISEVSRTITGLAYRINEVRLAVESPRQQSIMEIYNNPALP
jgi:hypothetical protein